MKTKTRAFFLSYSSGHERRLRRLTSCVVVVVAVVVVVVIIIIIVVVIVVTVVEYYRRGHHRTLFNTTGVFLSFLSLLVGSPERRKIFLFYSFLVSSLLHTHTHTHTHTHSRRRGDKDRQSSKCSFSLVVFSCFCAQREKKWSFESHVCAQLDFRFFFVQQFVHKVVSN